MFLIMSTMNVTSPALTACLYGLNRSSSHHLLHHRLILHRDIFKLASLLLKNFFQPGLDRFFILFLQREHLFDDLCYKRYIFLDIAALLELVSVFSFLESVLRELATAFLQGELDFLDDLGIMRD